MATRITSVFSSDRPGYVGVALPNITGTLSPLSAYGKMAPWQVNGVFSLKNLSAKVYDVDVISGPDSIIFDANLSNSIYKKQDGIQVDAFQILMIIKV